VDGMCRHHDHRVREGWSRRPRHSPTVRKAVALSPHHHCAHSRPPAGACHEDITTTRLKARGRWLSLAKEMPPGRVHRRKSLRSTTHRNLNAEQRSLPPPQPTLGVRACVRARPAIPAVCAECVPIRSRSPCCCCHLPPHTACACCCCCRCAAGRDDAI
jgi:hypothetical protein